MPSVKLTVSNHSGVFSDNIVIFKKETTTPTDHRAKAWRVLGHLETSQDHSFTFEMEGSPLFYVGNMGGVKLGDQIEDIHAAEQLKEFDFSGVERVDIMMTIKEEEDSSIGFDFNLT